MTESAPILAHEMPSYVMVGRHSDASAWAAEVGLLSRDWTLVIEQDSELAVFASLTHFRSPAARDCCNRLP